MKERHEPKPNYIHSEPSEQVEVDPFYNSEMKKIFDDVGTKSGNRADHTPRTKASDRSHPF